MRILIFADVHGNWDALLAMQAVETPPDAVLFLGDIVGFGPEPAACLRWVRNHATHTVRGNHDDALARGGEGRYSPGYEELARVTREYSWRMLGPGDLSYLDRLPSEQTVTLGGTRFYLAHGSPADNLYRGINLSTPQEVLAQELSGLEADVVLLGHTHLPMIRLVGRTYVVNPGSLGQPRHGSPSATYAIWEDGELGIRHVDYDYPVTQRKLGLLPLEPEHIGRLQRILEEGG